MTTLRKRVPWSHGDRLMMIVLALVVVGGGLGVWLHARAGTPTLVIPTPALPSPNAYDFYVKAGNSVTGANLVSPVVQPKTPTAAQAAVVQQNASPNGAIGILHQGFQYPCQAPPVRSFSAGFPQYAKLRGLARLLGLQARVNAARGDWEGAMTADLDCLRMGEDLSHGSGLIGMLVGDACEAIGRRPAWKTMDHLNAVQARGAARRLEAIRARHVPYVDTVQEEKWINLAGLMETMRRPDWPGDITGYSASGNGTPSLADTLSDWKTAALIRATGKQAILTNVTRYDDEKIADARQPYAAHLPAPSPPNDPVSQLMFSGDATGGAGLRLNEVKADTENALLMTMLALRAYRLEHGTYPVALAALTPVYLKAVPDDPFALSGPLRYKNTAGGYLLYSVGPDGKDDGGKPIFDTTHNAPAYPGATDPRRYVLPDSQGDVVAGVNVS